MRAAMSRNVEALFDVGYWQSEAARIFPEHVEMMNRALLEQLWIWRCDPGWSRRRRAPRVH